VLDGLLAGRDRELGELLEPARCLGVHVKGGLESSDLGRDLDRERAGIEPGDRTDARDGGGQADRRDGAEAGYDDAGWRDGWSLCVLPAARANERAEYRVLIFSRLTAQLPTSSAPSSRESW